MVKKGSTAADLPGKINFDIDPDTPKPGERYTVKVFLVNEGNAPIQLKDMFVTTTINGKKVGAPVPPQTRDVAPQQTRGGHEHRGSLEGGHHLLADGGHHPHRAR